MTKGFHRLVLFLVLLTGCGGEQFSTGDSVFVEGGSAGSGASATAGSAAGDSIGGSTAGGSSNAGGDTATGGDTTAAGSPPEGGSGGTDPNPQGGSSGSSQGGSAMAGTGGTGVVQICDPFAVKCSGKTLETCSADGSKWTSKNCDFICSADKGCFGACTPGAMRCEDGKSETCSAEGTWIVTQTCPFACQGEGVCGGSCVPGTKKCDGLTPQTCGQDAEWANGKDCANVCSAGTCTGSCVPGTTQCNGQTSQTCQDDGTWKDVKNCPFVCQGTGVCGGECVPGTKSCTGGIYIQSCDATGHWQTDSSCPYVCQNGACGGVCSPNKACSDDGNDCTDDVCSADGLTCKHTAKANGSSCGSSVDVECNKPDSCQAGVCKSNFSASGIACSDDGNTCTTDACNGSGACGHPAGNAGAVCHSASCNNGSLTPAATCTGSSTVCPSPAPVECYGMCTPAGDACSNGATKVLDAYAMMALDNDASYLYASVRTQAGVSQILKITKSNNASTVLYQDTDTSKYIYALIVAGTNIYLGETTWAGSTYTGNVTRINTTGANQTPDLVSGQATFGFAKNSTRVYWSDARQVACDCGSPAITHVYSVAIGGTSPTTFPLAFSSMELSPDLEVTDDSLYLWGMGAPVNSVYQPSLTRYDLANPTMVYASILPGYFMSGMTMVNLKATYSALPGLTKNNGYVLANVNTDNGTGIFRVSKADDTFKLLVANTQTSATFNFVADETSVYFDNQKVSVSGGVPTYTSAHDLAAPSTLTLDSGFLYFGSYGYWKSQPYVGSPDVTAKAFFKVAKN